MSIYYYLPIYLSIYLYAYLYPIYYLVKPSRDRPGRAGQDGVYLKVTVLSISSWVIKVRGNKRRGEEMICCLKVESWREQTDRRVEISEITETERVCKEERGREGIGGSIFWVGRGGGREVWCLRRLKGLVVWKKERKKGYVCRVGVMQNIIIPFRPLFFMCLSFFHSHRQTDRYQDKPV